MTFGEFHRNGDKAIQSFGQLGIELIEYRNGHPYTAYHEAERLGGHNGLVNQQIALTWLAS